MIRTTAQLIELIKRTLEQATPEQKRQLCEALGLPGAEPVVREPGDISDSDRKFLREVGVLWPTS